ncbi:MAG: hypothetical protein GQ470_05845 [Gammaproteobacteria bacterium]|nr:hypothetical protein [Gammaproteobacteria bacterium]
MLLFVFISSLLTPCTSMAAPQMQGGSDSPQAQHHYHEIELQAHCDATSSVSECSQLTMISIQTDNTTKPVPHLQLLYWIDLIPENQLVAATIHRAVFTQQWASSLPISSNPSRYLASFRRQLI